MSGRRAKTLRRLATLYRGHLAQERDAELRALLTRTWCAARARDRRDEGRLLRRYLRRLC